MDFLLNKNPDLLTLEEKAEQSLLPDVLSVGDIAKLWNPKKQKTISDCLLCEIAKKNIILFSYLDDETGKQIKTNEKNYEDCLIKSFKGVKGNLSDIAERFNNDSLSPFVEELFSILDDSPRYKNRFYIHKNDFKQWLVNNKQWPIEKCLLVHWLLDKKEIQFDSDLLNKPERQDDWFELINDMTTKFYEEHQKIPNEAQAWGALWKCSIPGYTVSTGKDRGEDCLQMPGRKSSLSHSAFKKRWAKLY